MKPFTRKENFLAKIAGDSDANELMKPKTRSESFLDKIAERLNNGGSSDPYSAWDVVIIKPEDGEWECVKGDYAEIRENVGLKPVTAVHFQYGVYGGVTYNYVFTGQDFSAEEGYISIEFQGSTSKTLYWLPDGSVSTTPPT